MPRKNKNEPFILNEQLGFHINRAALLFRRELIRAFREYNISPEQWQVLAGLWQKSPLNQVEIGAITLQEAPTLSRMIEKMSQNGWVRKTRDSEDKRSTLIELTPEGDKLREVLPPKLLSHFAELLRAFPRKKQDQLLRLLQELRTVMGDQT